MNLCRFVTAGQRPEFPVCRNADIQHLIVRCWAQNPAERPTAEEALDCLERIQLPLGNANFIFLLFLVSHANAFVFFFFCFFFYKKRKSYGV